MNPTVILSLVEIAVPFAVVGGIGYGVYKIIEEAQERAIANRAKKIGLRHGDNLEYQYAYQFYVLFSRAVWERKAHREKIIDTVRQASIDGVDWNKLRLYYSKITQGMEFKGNCLTTAKVFCALTFDASGAFDKHLALALGGRLPEAQKYMYAL